VPPGLLRQVQRPKGGVCQEDGGGSRPGQAAAKVLLSDNLEPLAAAASRALEHYPVAGDPPPRRWGNGLINDSFLVEAGNGERFVLQRLKPGLFPAVVHEDIAAVTEHLASHGVPTCRLVRTATGALWVELGPDQVWRLLTFVDGVSIDTTRDPRLLHSAGRLLASFHRALADLDHAFRPQQHPFHDTPYLLGLLRVCLESEAAHPRFAQLAALASEILAETEVVPALPATPDRVVHGDLKLNNIRFAPGHALEAAALIDLDTVRRGGLPAELGDAFRSWCNPAGEDGARAGFDVKLFRAAVGGWAEGARGFATAAEQEAIPDAVRTIALELASRFCRDAFEECYFGWDRSRFASASEHNELRARAQLAVARSVGEQIDDAREVVHRAFTGEV
jgi:Ser/Thr protein kinase RdoA (MazF antagonist)